MPALSHSVCRAGRSRRLRHPPDQSADHAGRPDNGLPFRDARGKANKENLVVLAFSGGGTRAAAFSYGVLEFLRNTEVVGPKGNKSRLLDAVDIITGVSGGSFTALAYGLYGDKLFADYEQRFLKRDVQGELIARALNPAYWGKLWSTAWGRSELAAELYDEILFNGATFGDLNRGAGPLIMASATDISTRLPLPLHAAMFDVICSDLNAVPLSRAAAASSAVPVVLSPVTINNYGGTCNDPAFLGTFIDSDNPPRPAARAIAALKELAGTSATASIARISISSMAVCRTTSACAACSIRWRFSRPCTRRPADAARQRAQDHRLHRQFAVVAADQLGRVGEPPGTVDILLKSAGTPIDAFSFEAVELLKDTAAQWQTMRVIRDSAAMAANKDPAVAAALRVPNAEIYAIDVSFAALKDKAEREYLNQQPTSFVLPPEAVDRLRAAAGRS